MFSLRLQGGIPLSEQLEARIAELIIGGEMAENEKLPAVREVAKALTILSLIHISEPTRPY